MKRIENECCDCATEEYPCIGDCCIYRNVPHYFCDKCGDETDIYYFDGEELCIYCIKEKLEKMV